MNKIILAGAAALAAGATVALPSAASARTYSSFSLYVGDGGYNDGYYDEPGYGYYGGPPYGYYSGYYSSRPYYYPYRGYSYDRWDHRRWDRGYRYRDRDRDHDGWHRHHRYHD